MVKKLIALGLFCLAILFFVVAKYNPSLVGAFAYNNSFNISFAILCMSASLLVHYVKLFKFINDSYIELLKVVWPGKNETLSTAMITTIVIIIASIIIRLIDFIAIKFIAFATGQ